jgi:glycosyltransferase involved in cell wall biosynthesis
MTVQILLSTYNGARYLKPLMESLLAQDVPDVEILVHDDGSSDNTTGLLHRYATTYKNVKVVFGPHLGFSRSFFTLLEIASPTADYLALCDQDDVWREDKVSRAVACLSQCPSEIPALYCSRLAVVDENLQPLKYSDVPRRGLSFRNALVENQVPGCTILLNQATRRPLTRIPSACVSHDWWIYLVVSAFGTLVYDEEPRILYRRHASNVFGVSTGKIDMWKVKVRQFLKDGKCKRIVKQAEEFRRMYGTVLSDEHRKVLEDFLESRKRLWDRLHYALACDVYRQSLRDHYLLKARIALDRL